MKLLALAPIAKASSRTAGCSGCETPAASAKWTSALRPFPCVQLCAGVTHLATRSRRSLHLRQRPLHAGQRQAAATERSDNAGCPLAIGPGARAAGGAEGRARVARELLLQDLVVA
jgi:hypothetical protein